MYSPSNTEVLNLKERSIPTMGKAFGRFLRIPPVLSRRYEGASVSSADSTIIAGRQRNLGVAVA